MLHPTKGVQHTKKQAFRQLVVDNQKSYASVSEIPHEIN